MIELPKGNPASWMHKLLGLDVFESAIFGEILFSCLDGGQPFCQSLKSIAEELGISYAKVRQVISSLEERGFILKQTDTSGRMAISVVENTLIDAIKETKSSAMEKHPCAMTKHSTATTKHTSATTKHTPGIIGSSLILNPKDVKDVEVLRKQDNTKQDIAYTHAQGLFKIEDFTDFVNGDPSEEKVREDLKSCELISVQSFVDMLYGYQAPFKLKSDCMNIAKDSRLPAYEMNAVLLDAFFHNKRRLPPKSYLLKMIERLSTYAQPSNAWETLKILEARKFNPSCASKESKRTDDGIPKLHRVEQDDDENLEWTQEELDFMNELDKKMGLR